MAPPRPIRILFICLGNICRSPIAEGVFIHLAKERGVGDRFVVDSAGTGNWHCGERPDPRAVAAAERRGVHLPSCARQLNTDDFDEFDLFVCMDESNRRNVLRLGAPESKVRLLLSFEPEATAREVPDPYQHGPKQFDEVFEMVHRACTCMLDQLLREGVTA